MSRSQNSFYILVFISVLVLIFNPACSKTEVSGDYSERSPDSLSSNVAESADGGIDSTAGPHSIGSSMGKGSGTSGSKSSGSSRSLSSSNKGQVDVIIQKIEAEYPNNELVKIEKDIVPRKNNGIILPGDFAQVTVSITSNAKDNLNFDLVEFVDTDLSVFRSSVHGYVLDDPILFCCYKKGVLNHIECGKIMTSSDKKNLTFNYAEKPITITETESKIVPMSENLSDGVPFLLNKSELFKWNEVLNESLNKCFDRYPNLSNFIQFKLNALDHSDIARSNITIYSNNIIIFKNKTPIISILNKSDDYIDFSHAHFLCNDHIFHLKLENGTVYDMDNTISFNNVSLQPSDSFVFWYFIKSPMKTGQFDITTLVINESINKLITYSSKTVEVVNSPNFEVTRTFSDYNKFLGDELKIIFDVNYLGGGSEPNIDDIVVRFDTSSEYEYISVDGNTSPSITNHPEIIKSFAVGESKPIEVVIRFNETGKISPPSLRINDVRKPFSTDTVNVDRPVDRYYNVLSLFAAAIPFFVVFVLQTYLEMGSNKRKLWWRLIGIRHWVFGHSLMIRVIYLIIFIIVLLLAFRMIIGLLNALIPIFIG